jgi:hypothetical protein
MSILLLFVFASCPFVCFYWGHLIIAIAAMIALVAIKFLAVRRIHETSHKQRLTDFSWMRRSKASFSRRMAVR